MVEVKNKGGGGHPSSSLTEDDRRALRGSKFAPLPVAGRPSSSRSNPRLAHPGGPLTTNKAAALAKFLERKLQQPGGLNSINPEILELAVKNAKETVNASKGEPSNSGRLIRHVASFGDVPEVQDSQEGGDEDQYKMGRKKLKKIKKVATHLEASKAVVKHKKRKKKKKKKKS